MSDRVTRTTTGLAGVGVTYPAWLGEAQIWVTFIVAVLSGLWIAWQLFWAVQKKLVGWRRQQPGRSRP